MNFFAYLLLVFYLFIAFLAARKSSRKILCKIEIPMNSANVIDNILSVAFFVIYISPIILYFLSSRIFSLANHEVPNGKIEILDKRHERQYQIENDQNMMEKIIHEYFIMPEKYFLKKGNVYNNIEDTQKLMELSVQGHDLRQLQTAKSRYYAIERKQADIHDELKIILNSMDNFDIQKLNASLREKFPLPWTNMKNSNQYRVYPNGIYEENNNFCRKYIIKATINKRYHQADYLDCQLSP